MMQDGGGRAKGTRRLCEWTAHQGGGGGVTRAGACRPGRRPTRGLPRLGVPLRTHADTDPNATTAVGRGGPWPPRRYHLHRQRRRRHIRRSPPPLSSATRASPRRRRRDCPRDMGHVRLGGGRVGGVSAAQTRHPTPPPRGAVARPPLDRRASVRRRSPTARRALGGVRAARRRCGGDRGVGADPRPTPRRRGGGRRGGRRWKPPRRPGAGAPCRAARVGEWRPRLGGGDAAGHGGGGAAGGVGLRPFLRCMPQDGIAYQRNDDFIHWSRASRGGITVRTNKREILAHVYTWGLHPVWSQHVIRRPQNSRCL